VQVRGVNNQSFTGVAVDRIGQSTLLEPKESISVDVRVDQDGLLTAMQQDPLTIMPLFFSVVTNPSTQAAGIAPGPAGYRAQFNQVLNRKASQLSPDTLQALAAQLQNGKGGVQILAIDKLNTFANLLHAQPDPVMVKKADEIGDIIRKAKGDPNSSVSAYAMMTSAMHSDQSIRDGILQQMLTDGDLSQKALGIIGVHLAVPQEARKEKLAAIADDEKADPIVRKLAQAAIEVAALPAPTTEPSGGQAPPPPLGP
jgi:hypothetical protein